VSELRYTNLVEDMAPQCAALELKAFPHADPEDLLSEADIRAYARTFPEGFFVCLDGDQVVGQGGGILLDFDFDHPQHSIAGITGEHQCGNHDPSGDWYYGTDMVVDPDYRRRGIGKRLYELRKGVVVQLNRKGIIAGGHLHNFAEYKHELSADEYIRKVDAGEIYDATLSFQKANGFRLLAALEDYLTDETTDNWSALIVWDNPDYEENP